MFYAGKQGMELQTELGLGFCEWSCMVLGSITSAASLPIRSVPHHFLKCWFFAYRIIEYPELKGADKDN